MLRRALLTIDDGPTDALDSILNTLDQHRIKVVFFSTGMRLAQKVSRGNQIISAGHELQNHSYSHLRLSKVGPEAMLSDVMRGKEFLKTTYGIESNLFRPPYGTVTPEFRQMFLDSGLTAIGWNVNWTRMLDPRKDRPMLDKAISVVSQNQTAIILLHCIKQDAEALDGVIGSLKSWGFEFPVSLIEELTSTQWY